MKNEIFDVYAPVEEREQKLEIYIRKFAKATIMAMLSNTHADTPEERNLLNKLMVSLDKEQ